MKVKTLLKALKAADPEATVTGPFGYVIGKAKVRKDGNVSLYAR